MNTSKPTTNELIALHLRYGQGAEPLRVRAYAQIVAKVLYTNIGNENTVNSIANDVANALGCRSVSRKQIVHALDFLNRKGHASELRSNWTLTDEGRTTIDTDLKRASGRITNVLQHHFPNRIDQSKLRPWFTEACLAFFQGFGDRWAYAICSGVPLKTSISDNFEDLLKSSLQKYDLEAEIEVLTRSFRAFITSTLPEDAEQLWSVGQAMFAARLVAANISADPITLREIRGSTILLDTNVLIVASLEKHRLADSLSALGKAFNQLGVHLHLLNISRDEYIHSVENNCHEIAKVVKRYDKQVFEKSFNTFLSTALARGCSEPEHFETFFDAIKDPPTSIDDSQSITLIDYPELNEAILKGTQDEILKSQISQAWTAARRTVKRSKAAEHDAGLIYAARFLRSQKERCWVLTLDRTLHEFDLRHTHSKEYPLLLSFDVLIQILGLEEAGPDFDPTVFAPIMSSIISYQLEPSLGTYTPEDLAWLLDLEERCADLPPDKVEDLALEVNNARLSGKSKDDPELRLRMQRVFQAQKLTLTGDLESARQLIHNKEDQLKDALFKRKSVEEAFVSNLRDQLRGNAKKKLRNSIRINLAVAFILTSGVAYLLFSFVPTSQPLVFLGFLLTALSPVFTVVFRIFYSNIPNYRIELDQVEDKVKREIDRILGLKFD